MPQKHWTFRLDDGSLHTVELKHGYLSGKREIYLDYKLIIEDKKFNDIGSTHSFQIGKHTCTVHIRMGGFSYKYDCTIDDRSVETGEEVKPLLPFPAWAWLFMIACLSIPFVTGGGAIPAAVGMGGAFLCAAVVKNPLKGTVTRVAICVGITFLGWIIVFIVLPVLFKS